MKKYGKWEPGKPEDRAIWRQLLDARKQRKERKDKQHRRKDGK